MLSSVTRSEAPPGTSSTTVLLSLWLAVLAAVVLIAGRTGTPGEVLGPGPGVDGEAEEAEVEVGSAAGAAAGVVELEGVVVVVVVSLLVAVGRSLWCHTWYRSSASAPGVDRMFWQVWYICGCIAGRDGKGHEVRRRAGRGSGIASEAAVAKLIYT